MAVNVVIWKHVPSHMTSSSTYEKDVVARVDPRQHESWAVITLVLDRNWIVFVHICLHCNSNRQMERYLSEGNWIKVKSVAHNWRNMQQPAYKRPIKHLPSPTLYINVILAILVSARVCERFTVYGRKKNGCVSEFFHGLQNQRGLFNVGPLLFLLSWFSSAFSIVFVYRKYAICLPLTPFYWFSFL